MVELVIPVLSIWLMDDRDSQVELPDQTFLTCTAVPYLQLSLAHFPFILTNNLSLSSLPFPNSPSNFVHGWSHLQFFRWPDQPRDLPAFSIFKLYLLFSTSSLDLYLISMSIIVCGLITFLLIYWVCPSYIWVLVNFLKHYFMLSMFFSKFSSDPLCLMSQVQVLYLGILSLSFFL